jgi:hypothetical protein
MRGSCSSAVVSAPVSDLPAATALGSERARSTTATSSRRSKGLGRYSKAPRSVALTAVSRVLRALMTMILRPGRSFLIRGIRSRPFSSGITTSVITRSPSPFWIHCQRVAALPEVRTL